MYGGHLGQKPKGAAPNLLVVVVEPAVVDRQTPQKRATQTTKSWQLTSVSWWVDAWIPDDPVRRDVKALDGTACWHPIFAETGFVKLVTHILQMPADVIVLDLRQSMNDASLEDLIRCNHLTTCVVRTACGKLRTFIVRRLDSVKGIHRGPTVGLLVAAALKHERFVVESAFFPLSYEALRKRPTTRWVLEGDRLCRFLSSGNSA